MTRQFLNQTQVANRLGISTYTLKKLVEAKQFPAPLVLGLRRRVWLDSVVEDALDRIARAQSENCSG